MNFALSKANSLEFSAMKLSSLYLLQKLKSLGFSGFLSSGGSAMTSLSSFACWLRTEICSMLGSMLLAISRKSWQKRSKNHSFANLLGASILKTPFSAEMYFIADNHCNSRSSLGFESKNAERHCSHIDEGTGSAVFKLTFTNTPKISKIFRCFAIG